jgi:hypothetical protein
MNIKLHIDHLILDGITVPHSRRHLLRASVQSELTRLFAEGGVSPSLANGTAVPQVSATGIQLSGSNDSVQLGRQIAQSVYGGIGK